MQILYGHSCDCTFCMDDDVIAAGRELRISRANPCAPGTTAAVSKLNIKTTDNTGIQIYTKDDPSSSKYYTDASSKSTVSCYDMGRGFVVGGVKPQIYVIIQCVEWSKSCHISHSIDLICTGVATTSTSTTVTRPTLTAVTTTTTFTRPTITAVSTTTPATGRTVTTVVIDNICECECCKGSATCQSTYVGVIPYSTTKCEVSDCVNQCAKQFSSCPSSKDQPGKIVAHCRNNDGITLKTTFYIPLLFTVFLYFC